MGYGKRIGRIMSWIINILIVIALISILFFGIDWFISFNIWQKRIYIGRWENDIEWIAALNRIAIKWMRRTPVVRQSENDRLVLWDILRGNYKRESIQSWQIAGLLMGVEKERGFRYFLSSQLDADSLKWKKEPLEVDEAIKGYVLLQYMSVNPQKYKPAMDQLYRCILQKRHLTGTIPYRSFLPTIRFVDTIGLVVPFLISYGVHYQQPESIQIAIAQIREYDAAKLVGTEFPAHAYNIEKQYPMGVYDWGRGIGWYILGLTESLKVIQGRDKSFEVELKQRICRLANGLLPCQTAEGGLSHMLFTNGNEIESSATVLGGILFLESYKISGEKTFLIAAIEAANALKGVTQRNGAIDNCQGDTHGIGYYSHARGYMPFVQGLTLRFARELQNYKE